MQPHRTESWTLPCHQHRGAVLVDPKLRGKSLGTLRNRSCRCSYRSRDTPWTLSPPGVPRRLHTMSPSCHRHPGASHHAGALEHHQVVSSPPGMTPAMEPQAPVCLPTPHTVAITSPHHGDPAIPEPLSEQHATELDACFTLCACLSPAIVLCCSLFSLEHQHQWLPWMKLLPLDTHNMFDPMPTRRADVVLLPLHQAMAPRRAQAEPKLLPWTTPTTSR
jgi:hypothetical protein